MSLRARFVLYLVLLHVLFAALAVDLLRKDRLWLLAVEALFVLSLLHGLGLVRRLFGTIDVLRSGALLLAESDFQARFRETGQPEMDALVRVYNRMADHLREERIRLQEQHYLLAKILDVSPAGIAILDFDGRLAFVNPGAERLLGQERAGLQGKPLAELRSPLGAELLALAPGESRVCALSGGRRVKCHKGSFVDRGFERHFVLMEELTEELRQYEKAAYEKLIRMLSHEVNNTVGAANSLLHSCLNYAPLLPPEERKDMESALGVVISRTEQLAAFMKGFADVVRLPAPRLEPCDLRKLVASIARLLEPAFGARGVTFRLDAAEPIAPLMLDRAQMEQALVNVLKNALEAAGPGGSVTARIARQDGRTALMIEDSGPGIPEAARAHLFTPFFSTKENGQGIGLTVVQEVLARHRFDCSLDGPPGGPTRFTILF